VSPSALLSYRAPRIRGKQSPVIIQLGLDAPGPCSSRPAPSSPPPFLPSTIARRRRHGAARRRSLPSGNPASAATTLGAPTSFASHVFTARTRTCRPLACLRKLVGGGKVGGGRTGLRINPGAAGGEGAERVGGAESGALLADDFLFDLPGSEQLD